MLDTKQNNINNNKEYEEMIEKRALNDNAGGFERGVTNAWAHATAGMYDVGAWVGNKLGYNTDNLEHEAEMYRLQAKIEEDTQNKKQEMGLSGKADVAKKNADNNIGQKERDMDESSKSSSNESSAKKEMTQDKSIEPQEAPAEDHSLRNEILLQVGLTALSFIPITAPFALATRGIILARSAYGAAKATSMGISAARSGNAAAEVASLTNTSSRVSKIAKIEDKIENKIENKATDKIEIGAANRAEKSNTKINEKPNDRPNNTSEKKENKSSLNRDKKERDKDNRDFGDSVRNYLDDDDKNKKEKEKKRNKIDTAGGGFAGLCAIIQMISHSIDEAKSGNNSDNSDGSDMDRDEKNRKKMSVGKYRKMGMVGQLTASHLMMSDMDSSLDDMQTSKEKLENQNYDVLENLKNKDEKPQSQTNTQNASIDQNVENTKSLKL